jgi:exodeoxyribonuclease VII small subunit
MKPDRDKLNFEQLLSALETTIKKLENQGTTLDTSLKEFEKGIALTRSAQQLLSDAEQKVMLLTDSGNGPVASEFDAEDEQ